MEPGGPQCGDSPDAKSSDVFGTLFIITKFTFTHLQLVFSVSRSIIFLPYFLCRPVRGPQEIGASVH